jgi:hypothetical protein
MIEGSTCPWCGHAGPGDARYCAYCGRAFAPLGPRLIGAIDGLLARLSRRHILWFGLSALFLVSMLADHLILHAGLFLPISYFLLVLVLALGGASLGWAWHLPWSGRRLLQRAVIVFAGMAAALVVVLKVDRLCLSSWAGTGRKAVFDIPGIHVEALGSFSPARLRYVVVDPPPYWLLVMAGILVVGLVGNLLRRSLAGRQLA